MESLEVNAGSVDAAVEIALRDLDAKLSEVEIIILSEGRAGILGIGAVDAKIRVTKLDVGRSRMSTEHFPPRPPTISYAPQSTDDEDDEDDEDATKQSSRRKLSRFPPEPHHSALRRPSVARGGSVDVGLRSAPSAPSKRRRRRQLKLSP